MDSFSLIKIFFTVLNSSRPTYGSLKYVKEMQKEKRVRPNLI